MNLQMTYDLRNAENAMAGAGEKEHRGKQKRPGIMLRNVKSKDATPSVEFAVFCTFSRRPFNSLDTTPST